LKRDFPQGLKPDDSVDFMYGLKPAPFKLSHCARARLLAGTHQRWQLAGLFLILRFSADQIRKCKTQKEGRQFRRPSFALYSQDL
jgi:hypothetical protein